MLNLDGKRLGDQYDETGCRRVFTFFGNQTLCWYSYESLVIWLKQWGFPLSLSLINRDIGQYFIAAFNVDFTIKAIVTFNPSARTTTNFRW